MGCLRVEKWNRREKTIEDRDIAADRGTFIINESGFIKILNETF